MLAECRPFGKAFIPPLDVRQARPVDIQAEIAIGGAADRDVADRQPVAGDIGAIGKSLQKKTGAKGKDLYMPVRIAVTGKLHGPELAKALPVLGPEECLSRINAIESML